MKVEIIIDNHRIKVYANINLLMVLFEEFKYDDYR